MLASVYNALVLFNL